MAGVPLSHTKSVYFPTAVKLSRGRQQQEEEEEEVVDIACGHFHALAVTGAPKSFLLLFLPLWVSQALQRRALAFSLIVN